MFTQAKEKFKFEHPKKIFILNSYHQTHKWVLEETKGYSPFLYRPDYELDIEYLNATNTEETPERNQILFNLFDELYSKKEYDLIILTSQPAYKFVALNYQRISFMHGIKIVCAGVKMDDTLPEIPNILFIPLQFSVNENVEQILKFLPNTTDIFVINDYTSSGIAARQVIQQQLKDAPALKGKKINLRYNQTANSVDLMREIKQLPPTTALLIGVYTQESKNYYLSPEELISILSDASSLPIFCMVDIYMQEEVVGGKMAEGFMLGIIIGEVVETLFNSGVVPYETIYREQSEWQFNYLQISNHNWFNALPKKAELKYKPLGFFEKYKLWIIPIIVVLTIAFIAFFIVLYFNKLLRIRLSEKTGSLRQYVSKFEQFVENMPVAYIELNTSYIIHYWNSTAEKMFGYQQKDVCNFHLDDIVNLQNNEAHISTIIKSIISRDISYSIIDVAKKDGSPMVCKWFFTAVSDEVGKPMYYMCMVVDITEERRLKQELEVMVENSKAMMLQNDRFIASSMHDLKNLMTPIIAYSELLSLEANTPKIQDTVAKLNKSASSVVQIFIEMMNISRIRSGLTHIDKQPLDLPVLVRDVISMLEINFKQKNIMLTTVIAPNTKVLADHKMTNSIFFNLLGNAIKFTYPKGNIIISTEQKGEDFIAISVANDGMPADIEKLNLLISNRKYFTTKGTSGEEGSGLGLLLCTDLVLKNGGELSITHYKNNSGACFTFTLPVAR
jgi:PAS domain S-box-containing protein